MKTQIHKFGGKKRYVLDFVIPLSMVNSNHRTNGHRTNGQMYQQHQKTEILKNDQNQTVSYTPAQQYQKVFYH